MSVANLHSSPAVDEASRRLSMLRAASKSVKSGRVTSSIIDTPNARAQIGGLFSQYKPLAYQLPWEILDYVELLATYNPDYSQAVENIKMLANSGHTLIVEAGSDLRQKRIKSYLEEKARVIQEPHGGVDGVIDKLLQQAATFGAIAGEWVMNDELTEVVDFVDLPPKAIRFYWDDNEQRYLPYQKVTSAQAKEAKDKGQKVVNNCVALNEFTFKYFAFNAAPASPYGVPPFLAALVNIAIQRDMVGNMAQIVKKIGLLGVIDLAIERLEPLPGETDEQYTSRASAYLEEYVSVAEDMVKEGGLVHYDDVTANTWQIGGNAAGATNIHKANEELIFSGLKSMPSVQGRSYCCHPDTRVLMTDLRWVKAGELHAGDEIIGFDEDLGQGKGKGSVARMKSAVVERNKRIKLPCVRIVTDKGTMVVSEQHPLVAVGQFKISENRTGYSGKHQGRWYKGRHWRQAADLVPGDQLVWWGAPWEESNTYDAGYLAGIFDGEGTLGYPGQGNNGAMTMAQLPGLVLDETVMALKREGFECSVRGPYEDGKCCHLALSGGKYETMRFLGSVRPYRLLAKSRQLWEGAMVRNGGALNKKVRQDLYANVLKVQRIGVQEVMAIQTSSKTFIGDGFLHHNSTTETYAGVAYEIILRNTTKYQRAVKRMLEHGYWLMVTLAGEQPDKIKIQFKENRTLNRQQEAQARKLEIANAIMLWLIGIIDQVGVAQTLGFSEPKTALDSPPPEAISRGSSLKLETDEDSDFSQSGESRERMVVNGRDEEEFSE